MKFRIILLLFILGCRVTWAQDSRHAIKFNLLGPIVKSIPIQYEFSLTPHKSLLFEAGYTLPINLFKPYYGKSKTFGTREIIFSDFRFNGGYQITPEYRYYISKKASAGFFVGGYLRYSKYSVQSHVKYIGENYNVLFTFKGVFSATNGGIITGYKWKLGSHFNIETWLLCLHAGMNSLKLSASNDFELIDAPQFLQDLQSTLSDIPVVRNWASNIVNRDVKVGFGYTFVGTRAGLCLGYTF